MPSNDRLVFGSDRPRDIVAGQQQEGVPNTPMGLHCPILTFENICLHGVKAGQISSASGILAQADVNHALALLQHGSCIGVRAGLDSTNGDWCLPDPALCRPTQAAAEIATADGRDGAARPYAP
jgi:hypothetical protein